MATLRQLVFDLKNIIRAGQQSDDELIGDRQVEFWVHNTRSMLINQDIAKHRSISDNIIQSLGCVSVSAVDASACCGITVDCTVIRTNVAIPNPIETNQKDLITRVGPADLTAPSYNLIPYQRASWAGRGRWTKKSLFAFLHDNFVYVLGEKSGLIQRINIQGVFEDPTQVSTFNNCAGQVCYNDEMEYPVSAKHIELMKQMILQNNFKIAAYAPTDVSGDTKANPEVVVAREGK